MDERRGHCNDCLHWKTAITKHPCIDCDINHSKFVSKYDQPFKTFKIDVHQQLLEQLEYENYQFKRKIEYLNHVNSVQDSRIVTLETDVINLKRKINAIYETFTITGGK